MVKRGKKTKKPTKKSTDIKLLVENNVALQRVLTGLSGDIHELTKEMNKLVGLFKEASKTLGEEKAIEDIKKDEKEELIPKLDELIDQNKTIAKGLILLESALRDKDREKEFRF